MNATRGEVALAPSAVSAEAGRAAASVGSGRFGFTAYGCPHHFTSYAAPAPYDDWVSVVACREGERSGREIMRVQPVSRRYIADQAAIDALMAEARDETMPWWARVGFGLASGLVRLLLAPLVLIGKAGEALGQFWWVGFLGLPAALAFLFLAGGALMAMFAVAVYVVPPVLAVFLFVVLPVRLREHATRRRIIGAAKGYAAASIIGDARVKLRRVGGT